MIPAFLAVTIPLVLTPGASTAVVLRNSLAWGTRAGVETAIGTNSASICYGVLTAFGFAVALRRWPSAWDALQILGAMYLGWLAVQSFRRAASGDALIVTTAPHADIARQGAFARNAYQGFLTNGLNPSVAAYYVVIVPQFVPAGAPVVRTTLLLTAIHVGLAATWHLAWAAAGGTLAHVFAGKRPRQILDVLAGGALAALAISLVLR